MRRQGFTLVELMIVIAIIAVIAAIAIPSLLRNKLEANQTAAVASLRAIAAGQTVYRQVFGPAQPVYAAQYRDLYYAKDASGQPIKVIDRALADAAADASAGSPKSGYIFADLKGDAQGAPYDPKVAWGVVAYPGLYNKSGLETFVINQDGSVYQNDRGANAPPPVNFPDVAAEGWMLVQ